MLFLFIFTILLWYSGEMVLDQFDKCKELDLRIFSISEKRFLKANQYDIKNFLRTFESRSALYILSNCDGVGVTDVVPGNDNVLINKTQMEGNVWLQFINSNGVVHMTIKYYNINNGFMGLINSFCEVVLL